MSTADTVKAVLMTPKTIALYVGLALALSWGLQLAAIRVWGLESDATRLIFVAAMWSPTLLALAFITLHRPARRGVLWRPGRLIWLPVGVTVETAIAFIIVAALVGAGWRQPVGSHSSPPA